MKFVLEVELADDADVVSELGRILRYWAGNLHHYPLEPGSGETITDSAYREVGRWEFAAPPGADAD